MSIFRVLLLSQLLVKSSVLCSERIDDKQLSVAYKNLTETLGNLNKGFPTVSIVNYDSDETIIDALILKNLKDENFPFKVTKLSEKSVQNRFSIDDSAILSFGSVNSLRRFNKNVDLTNEFPKKLRFFVHCSNATFQDISDLETTESSTEIQTKASSMAVGEILQFQYFLIEDEDSLKLFTFVWYTPEQCRVPQLIEVNRFDKEKNRWETPNFFIEKFTNFHGCQLVFGVEYKVLFAVCEEDADTFLEDGNGTACGGIYIEIIDALKVALNYEFKLNLYLPEEDAFNYNDQQVDSLITFGEYNDYHTKRDKIFITKPFIFEDQYLAVQPGEPYTVYEKLLLPFDEQTWTWICLTFAAAFSIIYVANFTRLSVRNFMFGRNVNTPTLNVVMIFCGIAQVTLPRRNFARFLTMMFIVYSLIIRTAYQGKMFEFMQKNVSKPAVASLEELIEKNWALFSFDNKMEYEKR